MAKKTKAADKKPAPVKKRAKPKAAAPARSKKLTDKIEKLLAKGRNKNVRFHWQGRATDKAIRKLEEALGVSLPPSYVAFLKRFGGSETVPGITGIKGKDPLKDSYQGPGDYGDFCSCYCETMNFRGDKKTLDRYVVVCPQWTWGFYCLDTSKSDNDGEYPVVYLPDVWDYKKGEQGEFKPLKGSGYDTFDEFLVFWLDQTVYERPGWGDD